MAVSYHLVFYHGAYRLFSNSFQSQPKEKGEADWPQCFGFPFLIYSPLSASVLWHLLCLPQVLRGHCKWFADYFGEPLQHPLVNSVTPYDVDSSILSTHSLTYSFSV